MGPVHQIVRIACSHNHQSSILQDLLEHQARRRRKMAFVHSVDYFFVHLWALEIATGDLLMYLMILNPCDCPKMIHHLAPDYESCLNQVNKDLVEQVEGIPTWHLCLRLQSTNTHPDPILYNNQTSIIIPNKYLLFSNLIIQTSWSSSWICLRSPESRESAVYTNTVPPCPLIPDPSSIIQRFVPSPLSKMKGSRQPVSASLGGGRDNIGSGIFSHDPKCSSPDQIDYSSINRCSHRTILGSIERMINQLHHLQDQQVGGS